MFVGKKKTTLVAIRYKSGISLCNLSKISSFFFFFFYYKKKILFLKPIEIFQDLKLWQ